MSDNRARPGSYWDTGPTGDLSASAPLPAPSIPPGPAPPVHGGTPSGTPRTDTFQHTPDIGYSGYSGYAAHPPPGGTAAHAPPQHRSGTAPGGLPPPMPRFTPPSGPPARVGAAVAALVCALLTLAFPLLFLALGFPVLTLLVNVPAIAFGIVGLTRLSDAMEVERFIRYTWACVLVYLVMMGAVLTAAVLVILSF